MGKQAVRPSVHGQETTTVEIGFDPELEGMPRSRGNRILYPDMFSKESEAILLRYWPIRDHRAVAKRIGVSATTCLRRYRELISQSPEKMPMPSRYTKHQSKLP